MKIKVPRNHRFVANGVVATRDGRSPAQSDCDRVIFSPQFQRLAGITQVSSFQDSATQHHNRLTHTMEVAAIGRRIAQRIGREQPELVTQVGGLDPDVVEAACLSHDLGHPPFGHVAEEELNDLASKDDESAGFEGNAQSFRIVVSLATRDDGYSGLDLTAATLNALLKYPWDRGNTGKKKRKWCIYSETPEEKTFKLLRANIHDDRQCPEAGIMDWADDIAYSVSDLADFYRMGIIPLDRLRSQAEVDDLFKGIRDTWRHERREPGENEATKLQRIDRRLEQLREAFVDLRDAYLLQFERPYSGTSAEQAVVARVVRAMIPHYAAQFRLRDPDSNAEKLTFEVGQKARDQVDMLKALTRHYAIRHPALATQQIGFKRIISGLFESISSILQHPREHHALPLSVRSDAVMEECRDNDKARIRKTCDIIAGLGEVQAIELYHRLTGISPGLSMMGPFR